MCKYCENMHPLIDLIWEDGARTEVILCPLKTHSFINVEFDPNYEEKEGERKRGRQVYSRAFYVDYCPKCGRNLREGNISES